MRECIFSNLYDVAEEKSVISEVNTEKCWRRIKYETGKASGEMLVTNDYSFPGKLTLNLNVSGVFDIYLCLPKLRRENVLFIKLTDDLAYTTMHAGKNTLKNWADEEFFEEIYWKTADLTNQKVLIDKRNVFFTSITGLAWIRLVPSSLDKIKEKKNKCMQMHFDTDSYGEEIYENPEDALVRVQMLKNSNVDFLSYETSLGSDSHSTIESQGWLNLSDKLRDAGYFTYRKNINEVYQKVISFCHENGIPIYAANRMEVANFTTPYSLASWNFEFPEKHSEFYMKTRDGRTVNACSFAYKEVQDFVIEKLKKDLKFGFDGVTLIFHRGMYIAFDKPVEERFNQKYPNLDMRLLPLKDKRLHEVLCEIMTGFMTRLRKEIPVKINVICDYGLETSKNIGIDVETWAKNGLIDSVSQADMEIFEDLDGLMQSDNPDLIDMEKYKKAITERTVVKRKFATDVEKVLKHIPEYKALKTKYGVTVYNVIPWVHTVKPEDYEGVVEKMKEKGAEKFLSWNTNHLVWDLPEWYSVCDIENKQSNDVVRRKFHRVLSLDGSDISQFNPNWRG